MAIPARATPTEKINPRKMRARIHCPPPVSPLRRVPNLRSRLPRTRAALDYAQERHAGQRRKADGAPFIEHPLEVGWLLYQQGAPDHVIAAGILHDTIEKGGAAAGELRERFGARVADLVLALSEDPAIPTYARRKAALRAQVDAAGAEALMVFAADKVSKVREFSRARSPRRLPQRRLTHYRRCLELLERRLSGSPLVTQLRAELEKVLSRAGAVPVALGPSV
jgi:(p)ppGpp synthase/HD superfamily hydrolase